MQSIEDALAASPLLAILRGVSPAEVEAIGEVLVANGFPILEVPLNSPEPYDSIARLAKRFGDQAIVGAGTVLKPEEVSRVADAGGRIIVAPNFNAEVVRATRRQGLISVPGVLTPSEAFAALDAGATALKIFPGDAISPAVIKAMRAVLPRESRLVVTGGVGEANMADFLNAGANGVGIGSSLYKPGKALAEVEQAAKALAAAAAAWRQAA